jgi:hypothetical protein
VAVISYHPSDAFSNAAATQRNSYYSVSGTPDTKMDGTQEVLGGVHTGTVFGSFRAYFDTRKLVPSPLAVELSTTYDSTSRQGHLVATIRNPGTSPVSGQLQVALAESHIYYVWQNMDSLHHVERAMLPDANGEAITVAPGESLVKIRDFLVNSAWNARNCELVAFVQNNSTREVLQGARTPLLPVPKVKYLGYQTAFPVPGAQVDLVLGLRNIGWAEASDLSAVLSSSDSNVTVLFSRADFPDIAGLGAGYSLTPFRIQVDSGCPDHYLARLNLAISMAGAPVRNETIPLNITTRNGFQDDMEAGINGWTHSGLNEQWHQTTHRSNSPSHSWYCGTEGTWQYTFENDARLTTPWFTLDSAAQVSFSHYCVTQPNWDYGIVDINNGSDFWSELAIFVGSIGGWNPVTCPAPDYSGQTVRIRFRFVDDDVTNSEGWYIDDFAAGLPTGLAQQPEAGASSLSLDAPGIVSSVVRLSYRLPAGAKGRIAIFDIAGQLVQLVAEDARGTGAATWALKDVRGNSVRNGCYFARLSAGPGQVVNKLVVAR